MSSTSGRSNKPTQDVSCPGYLQGQRQADEVHHHLLVGQLHTEETQQGEEGLVVLPPAAQLLAAQVDVSVELLSVLQSEGGGSRNEGRSTQVGGLQRSTGASLPRSDLFHEEVVLSGTLVHFELQHGDVRDDAAQRRERTRDVKDSQTLRL